MTDTAASTTETAAPETTITDPKADAAKAAEENHEDWKARAREWERRAKENSKAAEKLAALEDAQKTEAERLADIATNAQAEATQAKAEALRWKIAAKYRISDEDADTFLTGTDEDTLIRQAERLATLANPADTTTAPGPRPDLSQGARTGATSSGDPAKDFGNFIKRQLNS